MRIIITGSEGFIGTALVTQCLKAGIEVFGFDLVKKNKLSYGFTIGDMRNPAIADSFPDDAEAIDAVINCAAHAGGGQYLNTHAADVFADNVQMSLNLYAAVLRKSPKARVINLFSNCSYPGDKGLQREAEWLSGPVHESIFAYGNTKRILYYTADCYAKQYKIRSVNFLIPEVFGPGDYTDPARTHAVNGLVVRMIKAKRNKDAQFEIWGTGKPIRETMYIDDVVTLVLQGLRTKEDLLYPVNLGQGKGHSILETARIIADSLKFTGKLVCNTDYPDGAPKKVLDATRFKKVFPRYSFVDFRTGIRKTIAYYQSVL